MPYLIVSAETHEMIARAGTGGVVDGSETVLLSDGRVKFPVEDETMERIETLKRPGESTEDVLVRLLTRYLGLVN